MSEPETQIEAPAGTALALRPPAELEVAEVVARMAKIRTLMDSELKKDIDYGQIPGTDKPTLYKSGAEKLNVLFRFNPVTTLDYIWHDGALAGHLTVDATTAIRHHDGTEIASGVGLCSTLESKYRYRNARRSCPNCHAEGSIFKSNPQYGDGWFCSRRENGCGANFAANDPAIVGQQVGKIENPAVADSYNTVAKIASKRSFIDATLRATGASEIFTQDVEDSGGDDERKITDDQRRALFALVREHNVSEDALRALLMEMFGAGDTKAITTSRYEELLERVKSAGGAPASPDTPAPSRAPAPAAEPAASSASEAPADLPTADGGEQEADGQQGPADPPPAPSPAFEPAPPAEPEPTTLNPLEGITQLAPGVEPWEGYDGLNVGQVVQRVFGVAEAARNTDDPEVVGQVCDWLLAIGAYEQVSRGDRARKGVLDAISGFVHDLGGPGEDDAGQASSGAVDPMTEAGFAALELDSRRKALAAVLHYADSNPDYVPLRPWSTAAVIPQARQSFGNPGIASLEDLTGEQLGHIWNACPEPIRRAVLDVITL